MGYGFFQALDDHRFVYGRSEFRSAGSSGLYNLRTGEDLLMEKSGTPCHLYEGKLYTETSLIDLETREIETLPDPIRGVLRGVEWDILNIYQLETGELITTIQLEGEIGSWWLIGYPAEGVVGLHWTDWENNEELLRLIALD